MADETQNANVYTEAQHFALLTSAIERETASLSDKSTQLEAQVASLTTEKAGLATELETVQAKLDVAESEKASAEAARDAAVQEFKDFKDAQEKAQQIEQRKTERVAAVKAANANLQESYFSEERVQRWAEMADESFAALVADMTEAAAAVKAASETPADGTEQARETAAFTGGNTPTDDGKGQSLVSFLTAVRTPARA